MTSKISKFLSRRSFFASTGAAALTLGTAANARVTPGADSDYVYEVQHTSEEWQSMLSAEEYVVMREGYTENPKTGTMWQEDRDGTYHCRGCDLHVYSANNKVILDKGWVFFYHGEADSIMMAADGVPPEYGGMGGGDKVLTEAHCRRCGSHLGHILVIKRKLTHCINSYSLTFKPKTA